MQVRRGSRKVGESPEPVPDPTPTSPPAPPPSATPAPTSAPVAETQVRPGGKGRPTPKRSEAQRRRPSVTGPPPKSRKEAYARRREEAREARTATRQGMLRGDEKYLLPRDRGPVRALVRDVVDSRRSAGVLFLPLAVVVFVGQFVRVPEVQLAISALFLTVLVLMVVDLAVLGRLIVRTVRARFPGGVDDRTRSLVFYGLSRSTLFRRLRAPSPRVRVGDRV